MTSFGRLSLPRRVRRLFTMPFRTTERIGRELDEEVRFHLEHRIRDLVAAGRSVDQARAEALERFGDARELRAYCQRIKTPRLRRARVREWIGSWTQDLRFARRQFQHAPAFCAVAIATLALGIGANTAIFSVVHHLLIAPLAFRDGGRIVDISRTAAQGNILFSPDARLYEAWRARAHAFEQFTAARTTEYVLGAGERRARVQGAAVAANVFRFLGVAPVLGRSFTAGEQRPGGAPVVMLGYGTWQERFGGRTDVLGQTIRVDGSPRTIVGVAPPGFTVPYLDWSSSRALLTPLVIDSAGTFLNVIGKLRPDVTAAAASRELQAISASIGRNEPSYARTAVRVMRPQDYLGRETREALLILFAAVGAVLLVACANVANLFLARAWGRQREFAVRTALGAGRARLARQVLTESMLLALAGGVVGLCLAWAGLHAIMAIRPSALDALDAVRLEPAVLLWSCGISVFTGLLFGAAPALFSGGRIVSESLKAGARSIAGSMATRRLRAGLVVGEIALSVVLLVAAGLLVRSFRALQSVDVGFAARGLTMLSLQLPEDYPEAARAPAFATALERIRTTPGVRGASFGSLPVQSGVSSGGWMVEGGQHDAKVGVTSFNMVLPGYFRLVGIPLLAGRTFSGDTTGRKPGPEDEVIVNDALARRLWPAGHALGGRMRASATAPWKTVVGVAGSVHVPGEHGDRYDLQLYMPPMESFPSSEVVLRTDGGIDAILPQVRRAVSGASAEMTVGRVQTGEATLAVMVAAPRFEMTLLGAFAGIALLLAAVGLYGVIAYSVSQRTREIGVRVALGASAQDVLSLVLRQGVRLVLAGITFGVIAAALATRAMRSLLFGVQPGDPATFVVVAVGLVAVALLASYLPARRATRVDAMEALRAD